MGDQQKDTVPLGKVLFKPNDSLHVKMVSWLVKKETTSNVNARKNKMVRTYVCNV